MTRAEQLADMIEAALRARRNGRGTRIEMEHGDWELTIAGLRAHALVNKPEIEDFLRGVKLEAAHQVLRWGDAHDRDKSAKNWYWLVGYLAGKALRAAITGQRDKALHHCISSAAALLNWHQAVKRDTTGVGVGADADLREPV